MRYLAILLTLIPSLVSAWKVTEYSKADCNDMRQAISYNEKGKKKAHDGKISKEAHSIKFTEFGKGTSGTVALSGKPESKITEGACYNIAQDGKTTWKIKIK